MGGVPALLITSMPKTGTHPVLGAGCIARAAYAIWKGLGGRWGTTAGWYNSAITLAIR